MNIPVTLSQRFAGTVWKFNHPDRAYYNALEWLDQTIPKPTEAELQVAWLDIIEERNQFLLLVNRAREISQELTGQNIETITAAQARDIIKLLVIINGGVQRNGTIKPLLKWSNFDIGQ